jgi:ATP phosphoribosyltransferase regulatory subunit HisZ
LAKVSQVGEWRKIGGLPGALKPYLEELDQFILENGVTDGIIALLELPPFQYYTGVFYKIIGEQSIYARGGSYQIGEIKGVGFAIYTDYILEGKERENFQSVEERQ